MEYKTFHNNSQATERTGAILFLPSHFISEASLCHFCHVKQKGCLQMWSVRPAGSLEQTCGMNAV